MHLMYKSALCTILHLHMYTGSMVLEWPMLINSIDLIGELNIYVFDVYILHTFELLQTYYHYILMQLLGSLAGCTFTVSAARVQETATLSCLI